MKKIWIDITNTPQVNFLLPIIKSFEKKYKLIITARDFSETLVMLKDNNIEYLLVGEYKGKSRIRKIIGLIERVYKLIRKVPDFDLSFSMGGNYTSVVSRVRSKPSIIFSDNDLSFKALSYKFGNYFIIPECFRFETVMKRYDIKEDRVYKLNGFKEEVYIADYKKDVNFHSKIPFKEFITIRPENLKASYVPSESKSIVPELFKIFSDTNILFLPRYREEIEYAKGYSNIFIPNEPLKGLDVCLYSKAVLTGAGTFAREAAILGIPSVSFFPNKNLLSVDKILIEKDQIFHSRDPRKIRNYVDIAKKNINNISSCKKVKEQMLNFLIEIIENK